MMRADDIMTINDWPIKWTGEAKSHRQNEAVICGDGS
jgi:hypothetical protein